MNRKTFLSTWHRHKSKIGLILLCFAAFVGLLNMLKVVGEENHKRLLNPTTVTIDKCEYIVTHGGFFDSDKYIHKASCKNH